MSNNLQAKDLSRHFDHVTILASAGISVKRDHPELTRCPYCTQESLAIYNDPLSPGGYWFCCGGCRFSGDTIEALSRLQRVDIKDAIHRGRMQGFCSTPMAAKMTDEDINQYILSYPGRRQKFNEIWGTLRNNLREDLHPDLVRRAQADHLWGGMRRNFTEHFMRFMGGGVRRDVNKLFSHSVIPEGPGYETVFALNFQDIPGRTCAFQFLGQDENIIKFCTEADNLTKEGGLAMYDNLRPREGTVFAMGDSMMALHLQRCWLSDFTEPLKLVIYNEHTSKAWNSFNALRTIFWNKVIDWKLFNQARKVRNAFITAAPNLRKMEGDPYKYVFTRGAPAVLGTMEAEAVPWEQFFIEWICDRELPETTARETVMRLEFDTTERRHLLDSCLPAYKNRLELLLGDVRPIQSTTVRGQTVIEQNDGWWIAYSNGSKELLNDAPIKIHHEINDTANGVIYWRGIVRYRGTDLPYEAPLEVIEKDTVGWLRKIVAKAGLGSPQTSPGWAKQFISLAKSFSNPTALVGQCKLGIQPDGCVIFPRFKLVSGQVDTTEIVFKPADMPALDVQPPSIGRANLGRPFFPARVTFTCFMAAFVTNMLLRMRGEATKPVAVIGAENSTARIVGRHFAQVTGMRTIVMYKPPMRIPRTLFDDTREKLKKYDYPALLDADPAALSAWPADGGDNVFIFCDRITGLRMAASAPWIIIDNAELRCDTYPLPGMDDVLNYLLNLQGRDFDLDPSLPLLQAVLKDLQSWYSGYCGVTTAADTALVRESGRKVHALTPGEAMVYLACTLIRSGAMKTDFKPFLDDARKQKPLSRTSVLIDLHHQKVFIPRGPLTGPKSGIQARFDGAAITAEFVRKEILSCQDRISEGWIIDMDYWNAVSQAWNATSSAPAASAHAPSQEAREEGPASATP